MKFLKFKLAIIFLFTTLSVPSVAASLRQIRQLANQRYPESQHALGRMYANGTGVRRNRTKAKDFFSQACASDNQASCDNYLTLSSQGYY